MCEGVAGHYILLGHPYVVHPQLGPRWLLGLVGVGPKQAAGATCCSFTDHQQSVISLQTAKLKVSCIAVIDTCPANGSDPCPCRVQTASPGEQFQECLA